MSIDEKFNRNTQPNLQELIKAERQEFQGMQIQTGTPESLVNIQETELRSISSNKVLKILSEAYHILDRVRAKRLNTSDLGRWESNPLISVIIPVYHNKPEYLDQCLDSVLKQSYQNIEVVVVDDCSTDRRIDEVLEKYKQDSRVRCFENEQKLGKCQTINRALKVASADWYALIDDEDWLAPYAIEKLMRILAKNPNTFLGYTDSYSYNQNTKRKRKNKFSNIPSTCFHENFKMGESIRNLVLIHRSVFARVGLFEGRHEPTYILDFILKVTFYMGQEVFAYLHRPVYYQRVHNKKNAQTDCGAMQQQIELLMEVAKKRNAIEDGTYDKKISFVILSLNKMEQTYECLKSIEETVKVKYDVVLLDNHSSEETIAFIKTNIEPMDNVKVIYAEKNLGPAGGREVAVKHATGEYLVFLDNDIVVHEKWLPEMLIRLENYDRVGAVSCKVLFPDGLVQFNAMKSTIEKPFISFSLTGFRQDNMNLETCDYEENDWVPGGATLYRTDVFKGLEGLTEYPNTYEDNEAGFQMKRLGYRILNAPSAIVTHNHYTYMKASKGTEEYLAARYNDENLIKSSLTFYRRNGLIVKDEFILGKMGLNVNEAQKAVEEFERRLQS